MRHPSEEEAEALRPLFEALEDALSAVEAAVKRVRRDCQAPADAVLDEFAMLWCKRTQQGLEPLE